MIISQKEGNRQRLIENSDETHTNNKYWSSANIRQKSFENMKIDETTNSIRETKELDELDDIMSRASFSIALEIAVSLLSHDDSYTDRIYSPSSIRTKSAHNYSSFSSLRLSREINSLLFFTISSNALSPPGGAAILFKSCLS